MSKKSRYTEPFYATPYSLHTHPLWQSATNDEKEILRILQFRSATCAMDYNNNGVMIRLKRGQCCMTLEQLSEESKTSIKKVRQALNHFSGFRRNGKSARLCCDHVVPILRAQKRAQKRAQEKMVVDILLDGYLEKEGTEKGTEKGTKKGTERAQRGHTNKEVEEAKNIGEPISEPINIGDISEARAQARSPIYESSPTVSPVSLVEHPLGDNIFRRFKIVEEVLNDERVKNFCTAKGKKPNKETMERWVGILGTNIFILFDWFEYRCQRAKKIFTENYVENGIKKGLWKEWQGRTELRECEERNKRKAR